MSMSIAVRSPAGTTAGNIYIFIKYFLQWYTCGAPYNNLGRADDFVCVNADNSAAHTTTRSQCGNCGGGGFSPQASSRLQTLISE